MQEQYRGYWIKPDTYGFEYYHESYDGPPDRRCGHANTIADAMTQIDEIEDDA